MKKPKVSVSLITYNQEEYIGKCLDSVISQVTDFDFEIVVADDCSTDRTPQIVSEYAIKYPNLIKPILRQANLGISENGISTIKACSGQYIALLEGDDFWVDDHKLQIQADYLDKNEDCVFCFTNQYYFYDDEIVPAKMHVFYTEGKKPPEKFERDFFLKNNLIIPNNTKMFRREATPEILPDWFYHSVNWDWVLHIFQSANGKIGYIDRVTLAYRRHSEAVFMSKDDIKILLNGIDTIKAVNKYLNYQYDYRLKNLSWEYHELAFAYLKNRNLVSFLAYYIKYISALNRLGEIKVKDDLSLVKTALKKKIVR